MEVAPILQRGELMFDFCERSTLRTESAGFLSDNLRIADATCE